MNMGNPKKVQKNVQNDKVKVSLLIKLLCVAIIPMVILGIATLLTGSLRLKDQMREDMYNELKGVVTSVNLTLSQVNDSDITEEKGVVKKGDYTLTDNFELLDQIKERTGIEVSIFYGDERLITTVRDNAGKRTVGIKASDKVIKDVITEGKDFEGVVKIGGNNYLGYYTPLKDNSGKIIGMVFAGKSQNKIDTSVSHTILNFTVIGGIVLLVAIIVNVLFMKKVINKIKMINEYLHHISGGDLKQRINPKVLCDKSEIGQMGRSAHILNESILHMVRDIKDSTHNLNLSAETINQTSEMTHKMTQDVDKAIEEIASGAMSQAEETQSATNNVITMGERIEAMGSCVERLTNNSNHMHHTGDEALKIINRLSESNNKTLDVVDKISQQTQNTFDSAQRIGQAITLITSIADETNLLSLNASIEAARAGENGRGFAVVASEIQQLAEQSNQSAQEIQKIVETLLSDADKTVDTMEEVKKIVNEQSNRLDETQNKFNDVSKGINLSIENIHEINREIAVLTESRNAIIETIQSLSAISEENAAASQETTATMQELTTAIGKLAEEVDKLDELSDTLRKNVDEFNL